MLDYPEGLSTCMYTCIYVNIHISYVCMIYMYVYMYIREFTYIICMYDMCINICMYNMCGNTRMYDMCINTCISTHLQMYIVDVNYIHPIYTHEIYSPVIHIHT